MEILFVLENLRRPQHGIGLLAQQVSIRNIGVDVRIAVIGIGDILRYHRHRDHVAAADDEQIVGFVLGGAAPETEIVGQQIPVPDPRIRRRKAHPAVVARFGVDESVIRGVDDMVADTVRERRISISRQQFAHRAGIGAEFAGERPQVGEKDSFGHPPAGFLGIATLRTAGCGSPRSRAGERPEPQIPAERSEPQVLRKLPTQSKRSVRPQKRKRRGRDGPPGRPDRSDPPEQERPEPLKPERTDRPEAAEADRPALRAVWCRSSSRTKRYPRTFFHNWDKTSRIGF